MDEIDTHERACQEKFKQIRENKLEIDKTLNDSNEFLLISSDLLKQFRLIDDSKLMSSINRTYSLLTQLESTQDKLELEIFNECLLKFEKKL
jgi:hypothetical protein